LYNPVLPSTLAIHITTESTYSAVRGVADHSL